MTVLQLIALAGGLQERLGVVVVPAGRTSDVHRFYKEVAQQKRIEQNTGSRLATPCSMSRPRILGCALLTPRRRRHRTRLYAAPTLRPTRVHAGRRHGACPCLVRRLHRIQAASSTVVRCSAGLDRGRRRFDATSRRRSTLGFAGSRRF
jgi:hypothetical protein